MTDRLRVIIVEKDAARAQLMIESLAAAGAYDVSIVAEQADLAARISEINPDVVLIDMMNPSRDTLEEMALASGPLERPVAMFVDQSDANLTRAAIEAGVSAYIVDGMQPERVTPIIDAAVTRFTMFQRMRTELETTKRALEERKVVDRAKGMIMKARGVSEEEAYALLRKTAMDQHKRMVDVAQALVSTAGLLS